MTSGDTAPGGGTVYYSFHADQLTQDGDVIFSTWLENLGAGFYRTNDGALELLGRAGDEAPGDVKYGVCMSWYSGSMNEAGDSTFGFFIDGIPTEGRPSGGNTGTFRVDSDGVKTALLLPDTTLAPNGKPFHGTTLRTSINNKGDVVFHGIIETDEGIHMPSEEYHGLGMGVFMADSDNTIKSLVSPGDPAPGGGTFDFAENAFMNERGDVAFGAHVAGEECRLLGHSQAQRIFCGESVYLRKKDGTITSIAHQDDAAPGGGTYRLAFGPVLNNRGDILFIGDLTPAPDLFTSLGVFLHRRGKTVAVARPGDAMPGGGNLVSASGYISGYDLSDNGQVVFFAQLDTDEDGDTKPDTGIYAWRNEVVHLIARTGTQIPNLGTVQKVANGSGYGITNNNSGQVAIPVHLTDGKKALVIATPQY
ncbi:DUF7453 family protein [Polyangium aurulentum]|uniref:DUF7453 family protein n=1 Tax=Polyangium aurulentum TaxID=2567896 RepID=UPI0030843085